MVNDLSLAVLSRLYGLCDLCCVFGCSGDSQPLDVCAVHHKSSLVRYSVSLVGYGFYGDVLAESERHRWMGPLRYDYSGERGSSGGGVEDLWQCKRTLPQIELPA